MSNASISIGGREISDLQPPFIIAELSGNHSQDLSVAEEMIVAAAAAGVDAIKLQTYTADTLTIDSDKKEFTINEKDSLWYGKTLYSLYDKAHTPWDWHRDLFLLAKAHGVIAFSSPFDESSVDFLESLDVPCYKIASFELTHFPLLKCIAETRKPVIMSTGMATIEEINDSLNYLSHHGCEQVALLKCTSAYPAPVNEANLQTLIDMKKRFSVPVGLSDHCQGIGVASTAISLGANIIERHLVLDKNSCAVDAAFSSTPNEFSLLRSPTVIVDESVGRVHYGATESDQDSTKYRRSIYVSENIDAGDLLGPNNIRVVRPGFGLAPKYWEQVIGKRLTKPVTKGTALSWDLLDDS